MFWNQNCHKKITVFTYFGPIQHTHIYISVIILLSHTLRQLSYIVDYDKKTLIDTFKVMVNNQFKESFYGKKKQKTKKKKNN